VEGNRKEDECVLGEVDMEKRMPTSSVILPIHWIHVQPRAISRYSLLLQPFLISPAINTCDIMVGIHRAGKSVSLDDAVRRAHPFPILERYVADPIVDESGKVIIPGDTQVLFFANDFESTVGWPIFSSGRRSCAGMHFARGYLTVLRSSLLGHPRFRPEAGHRFSGRNNDRLEWGELVYLICTVPVAIFGRSKQT
jgi:hypothetical protein